MTDDEIAKAIRDALISPNELDKDWGDANVVDGLFFIGRGLYAIAEALERLAEKDDAH
jgi:hypothetical protein